MTNMMIAQRIKRVGEERRQEKAVRVEVAEAGLGAYTRQSILVSKKRKRKRARSQNLERNRQMKNAERDLNHHFWACNRRKRCSS